MSAIVLSDVSKKYRRPGGGALATTLKSYLLRDAWRRGPRQANVDRDAIWALRNVSLEFTEGSTVGVIGRNGSGKSTLLKIIGRILGPDSGKVTVNGKIAALIELGAGFHPELTGRENIVINGVILGLTRQEIKARMDDIIAFADIGEFINYPVRTYSSGMYARLGFAVAINVNPDILLIDEILSVGDADFTKKCHDALNRFKGMGKSIVVVSHSLEMMRSWCDEVIWLEGGRLRMMDDATTVVDAYEQAIAGGRVSNKSGSIAAQARATRR